MLHFLLQMPIHKNLNYKNTQIMKLKLFISTISFILVLIGCNNSKKEKTVASLISYPLEQTTLTDDFIPFIDSVEVIALEAKEGSFITQIEKILLTPNKQIIILNSTGIMLFDTNGTFLHRIGKIGRGPEEYQKVYDICLDQSGHNLLAVDYNNQVLEYSLNDGRLIQKIKPYLPQQYPPCVGIAPSQENGFFLFGCNPYNESDFDNDFYCLHQFDKTGKHLENLLLREDYVLTPTMITQSYDNSYLIRPQTCDHICYRIKNGEVSPFIKIDFKEKNIPCRYIKFQPQEGFDIQRFLFAPYYKFPIYFHETQDQLYFCCAGPDKANNIFFLINKKKSKGIRWEVSGENNPNLILGKTSDENFFYYIFHDYNEYNRLDLPHNMDPLKKYLIGQKNIKLEEDSNPAIIKIKFNI